MTELSEFVSERCPICNGHKRKGQSFCRNCYFALPLALRQALYHRFGEGYEQAVEAARIWLRNQRKEEKAAMG